MDEFSLINQYFTDCGQSLYPVELGIGDDAAVLDIKDPKKLVMTMDTLIENVHFPINTSPADIAHKALAVNLSDLAAMGAKPAWFLLSISIPDLNTDWLKEFSKSLCQQAQMYGIKLIGGDTCKGPLSITIQATGFVDKPILRSGANIGDRIFVSGSLGNAALGLALIQDKIELFPNGSSCIKALNCPIPRFDIANIVNAYASSMIDISDGILSDLGHILSASKCGADIYVDAIPKLNLTSIENLLQYALAGGDDYELCFTVPKDRVSKMNDLLQQHDLCVYDIGKITQSGLQVFDGEEKLNSSDIKGFNHFG